MRNFFDRIRAGLSRFMMGRYGSDKLNMAILVVALVLCLVAVFVPWPLVASLLMVCYWVLLGIAVFRMLSRNTYKRYQENRKFLMLKTRLTDRQYKYFDCPRCRQQVRVPRGKGKIAIHCPKCKETFIKKT